MNFNALLVIDGSLTQTFMNQNIHFNFGMMVLIIGMIVLIFLIVVFNQKIKHKIFIKNKKESY